MGKVQGDKKLNTPAINARNVKTRIPDSGSLDFGANGLNRALASDIVFWSEGSSIELVLSDDPVVLSQIAPLARFAWCLGSWCPPLQQLVEYRQGDVYSTRLC